MNYYLSLAHKFDCGNITGDHLLVMGVHAVLNMDCNLSGLMLPYQLFLVVTNRLLQVMTVAKAGLCGS